MAFFTNPNDWYFAIGGDQTQVFHSGRGVFVPAADAAFIAWMSVGKTATALPSVSDLGSVLAQFLVRPIDVSVLDAYTSVQATDIAGQIVFKISFNLLKRVAVLEGKTAPTAAQALAFAKTIM